MFKIIFAALLAFGLSAQAMEVDSLSIDNQLTLLYGTASTIPLFDSSKNLISSSVSSSDFLSIFTSPGNSKYYGSDGSGALGFYTLPSSAVWGSITGTLSNQTDLQNALNAKQNSLTFGNLTIPTNPNLSISNGGGAVIGTGTALSLIGASIVEATSNVLTLTGATNAVLGTGVSIQVKQASASQSGYLSSTDWNDFHDKQAAFTAQLANTVFAGPSSGSDDLPTFRSLVSADIPDLSGSYLPLTGGTMQGDVDFNGYNLFNVGSLNLPSGGSISDDGVGGVVLNTVDVDSGGNIEITNFGAVINGASAYNLSNSSSFSTDGGDGVSIITSSVKQYVFGDDGTFNAPGDITTMGSGNFNSALTVASGNFAVGAGGGLTTTGNVTLQGYAGNAVLYLDGSSALQTSATTPTQLEFLNTTTSNVQTQINAKAPTASPTFTGTLTVPNIAPTAAQTTVSGSVSGSCIFSEPRVGSSEKRVIVFLNALNGSCSYTFPVAFLQFPNAPNYLGLPGSDFSAVSKTATTVTAASTSTGILTLEGF